MSNEQAMIKAMAGMLIRGWPAERILSAIEVYVKEYGNAC